MPLRYKREDYNHMANLRRVAFKAIADKLGPKHEITRMMGSLAWGRSNFEQGGDSNLQTAIREMSGLDGFFDAINHWARDHDSNAQRVMLDLYPRGFASAP